MRILLADDHTLFRQGLRRLLVERPSWTVVAEAFTGETAVEAASTQRPDVAILDVAMPGMGGISAARQIRRASPGTRVLMLSMYAEPTYVTECFDAGATGYLLKDAADTELFTAIQVVASGSRYVSQGLDPRPDTAATRAYASLTPREREVFALVAMPLANREIATRLGITVTTVETHRTRMLSKLGLHSAAEVARFAIEQKLIAPPPGAP